MALTQTQLAKVALLRKGDIISDADWIAMRVSDDAANQIINAYAAKEIINLQNQQQQNNWQINQFTTKNTDITNKLTILQS